MTVSGISGTNAIKYASLITLIIQNCISALVIRLSLTGNRQPYIKTIVVFVTEIGKLLVSFALVFLSEKSVTRGLRSIRSEYSSHSREAVLICVPALIYTFQNVLHYVALEHLSISTYTITIQLKILTTALFTVLILKRRLSAVQWIALFLLFGGVNVVQFEQQAAKRHTAAIRSADDNATAVPVMELIENVTATARLDSSPTATPERPERHENMMIGLAAVIATCFSSGFAGIYFEKMLKNEREVCLWIRNIQLAIPAAVFSLIFAAVNDHSSLFHSPLPFPQSAFAGFDPAVWLVIAIGVFGGLIVAVVIKYADNVIKGFAMSLSILANCLMDYLFFEFHPRVLFAVGAAVVITSVVLYSLNPYRPPKMVDVEVASDKEKTLQ